MSINLTKRFARVIQSLLSQQMNAIRAFLTPQFIMRRERVNLSSWEGPMIAVLKPLLLEEYRTGMTASALALQRQGIPIDIRGLRRRLAEKVNEDVERLVRELNKASTDKINELLKEARKRIKVGDGPINISRRVQWTSFNALASPLRSTTIADNELLRSREGGKLLAANSTSGRIKKHKWECEANACPRCRKLNGKIVEIGKPFYIDPNGGPYALWINPPGHVNCKCKTTLIMSKRK